MAFATGGLRPVRRSGCLNTLKCASSESSRRDFLKFAVPAVVAGWPLAFGRAEDDVPSTSLYDLTSTMGGEKVELSKYRGGILWVPRAIVEFCAEFTTVAIVPNVREGCSGCQRCHLLCFDAAI